MDKLTIDYLYFDKEECDRCQDSEQVLDQVLEEMKPKLGEVEINKTQVGEKDIEKSPTIRINGKDLEEILGKEKESQSNHCGPCSSMCGQDTECRTYEYKGEKSDSIPKQMLKDAILKELSEK